MGSIPIDFFFFFFFCDTAGPADAVGKLNVSLIMSSCRADGNDFLSLQPVFFYETKAIYAVVPRGFYNLIE